MLSTAKHLSVGKGFTLVFFPLSIKHFFLLSSIAFLTTCFAIGGPPDEFVQSVFDARVQVVEKQRCRLAVGDREAGVTERWMISVAVPEFNDYNAVIIVKMNGEWHHSMSLDVARHCP
jgi:hypothetical protein